MGPTQHHFSSNLSISLGRLVPIWLAFEGRAVDPKHLLLAPYIAVTQRVQVPHDHVLAQSLCYNYSYPKPKHLIIGYLDPLGKV